ncbi:hypothetical protein EZV62_019084 [Acer yangbiense]|uniref:RNase H type-1 domain-containing protein n=1 Tax=Acer yangbiense TaxID=1000413 RepID=A0A5C7HA44_9ROSI|nr:hypothetical protein EZV62_019084 [Acer yangbiense]
MITWAIRENRNSSINSGLQKCPDQVASRGMSFLEEYQNTRNVLPARIIPSPRHLSPDWLAPPLGRLKLNTAVAVRKNTNCIGIGAAIRDVKGMVLVARSFTLTGNFSTEVGGLLALREGTFDAQRQ